MLIEVKTSYLGTHFGTLTQCSAYPSVPVLLTKEMRYVMTLSLHSASMSRFLEPSPQGLMSGILKFGGTN